MADKTGKNRARRLAKGWRKHLRRVKEVARRGGPARS